MRFTADENIPRVLVEWLRTAGEDVRWFKEEGRGSSDLVVLARSVAEGRVLVTSDKDFGDLVFRGRFRALGVILLRIRAAGSRELLEKLIPQWPRAVELAPGNFVIVEERVIRTRALPREE